MAIAVDSSFLWLRIHPAPTTVSSAPLPCRIPHPRAARPERVTAPALLRPLHYYGTNGRFVNMGGRLLRLSGREQLTQSLEKGLGIRRCVVGLEGGPDQRLGVPAVQGDLDPISLIQPALQQLHLNLGQSGGEHLPEPLRTVRADGFQSGQRVDLRPRPAGKVMAASANGGPIVLGLKVDGRRDGEWPGAPNVLSCHRRAVTSVAGTATYTLIHSGRLTALAPGTRREANHGPSKRA